MGRRPSGTCTSSRWTRGRAGWARDGGSCRNRSGSSDLAERIGCSRPCRGTTIPRCACSNPGFERVARRVLWRWYRWRGLSVQMRMLLAPHEVLLVRTFTDPSPTSAEESRGLSTVFRRTDAAPANRAGNGSGAPPHAEVGFAGDCDALGGDERLDATREVLDKGLTHFRGHRPKLAFVVAPRQHVREVFCGVPQGCRVSFCEVTRSPKS